MRLVSLGLCTGSVIISTAAGGGGDLPYWSASLLAIAIASILAYSKPANITLQTSDRFFLAVLVALPAYVAFQLIPLPQGILGLIDPARLTIAQAMGAAVGGQAGALAPVSLAPANTAIHLSRFVGYVLLALVVRNVAQRTTRWVILLPILMVAGVEALIGLGQEALHPKVVVGSFINKNHFSAFLEMALPLAVAQGAAMLSSPRRGGLSARTAATSAGCFALAALLLAGIALSGSKLGFASGAVAVAIMTIAGLGSSSRSHRTLLVVGLLFAAIVVAVLVAPGPLLLAFSDAAGDATAENRLPIARDTLSLIAAYPIVGSGLGTFFPALLPYQTSALNVAWVNAHNDYLELLSTLGVVGFSLIACCVVATLWRCEMAVSHGDRTERYAALGLLGAFAAIGVHSLGEFNAYVPATALTVAWLVGVASTLRSSSTEPSTGPATSSMTLVRGFALSAGALSIAYASGWLVFANGFAGRPDAEEVFCSFGICDTNGTFATWQKEYGDQPGAVPPALAARLVQREPAAFYRWCDLGDSLLAAGRRHDAEIAFANAQRLGPRIPTMLVRASSFYFQIGKRDKAFEMAVQSLETRSGLEQLTFDAYDAQHLTASETLQRGLPADKDIWLAYLHRQMQPRWVADAIETWNAVIAHGYGDADSAAQMATFLVNQNHVAEGRMAWAQFASPSGGNAASLLFNGGFESAPARTPFDWNLVQRDGNKTVLDGHHAVNGTRSARVEFDGSQNVSWPVLSQAAYLLPGKYLFRAQVRSEGLTTNEGPYFEVIGKNFRATTEKTTGSVGWHVVEQTLDIPPQSAGIQVHLTRDRSLKFDNKIKGTVWVDDVEIVPVVRTAAITPPHSPGASTE